MQIIARYILIHIKSITNKTFIQYFFKFCAKKNITCFRNKKGVSMQISNIQNHNLNNNVSFKASVPPLEKVLMPDKGRISHKSAKLIDELNKCIDKEWTDIRKGKLIAEKPLFTLDGKSGLTSFEPVYTQQYPALKIDCEDGRFTHEILLDRNNPNNFRYEKTVRTDYGSATLKSYDSRTANDKNINKFVSDLIEDKVDKILMNEIWDKVLNRTKEEVLPF